MRNNENEKISNQKININDFIIIIIQFFFNNIENLIIGKFYTHL